MRTLVGPAPIVLVLLCSVPASASHETRRCVDDVDSRLCVAIARQEALWSANATIPDDDGATRASVDGDRLLDDVLFLAEDLAEGSPVPLVDFDPDAFRSAVAGLASIVDARVEQAMDAAESAIGPAHVQKRS